MKSIYDQNTFALSDIEALIAMKAEESYYLEFKDGLALSLEDTDKVELSRDVSAFANSDGGILVYGLSESKGRAKKISWVSHKAINKEWIQQVIDSKVTQRLTKLELHVISHPDNLDERIFLLKIHPSTQAPHMAHDNCYYERDNKGKRKMMEHQVRAMYLRRGNTDLELVEIKGKEGTDMHPSNGKPTQVKFSLGFLVQNIGQAVEKDFKMEVRTVANISTRSSYVGNHNEFYDRSEGNEAILTFGSRTSLFQGETFPTGNIDILVPHSLYSFFAAGKLRIKLYYSGGTKEYNYDMIDFLKYKGGQLLAENMSPR